MVDAENWRKLEPKVVSMWSNNLLKVSGTLEVKAKDDNNFASKSL